MTQYLNFHFVRRPRDMVLTPLNQNNVVSSFSHHVIHSIIIASRVLNLHLLAGSFRSVDAHVQDVIA